MWNRHFFHPPFFCWVVLFGVFVFVTGARGANGLTGEVVVLANAVEPESLELARYYLQARGLDAGNLIALPLPKEETISWRQFIDTVQTPLQAELFRRGWLEGVMQESTDPLGRPLHVITGHRLAALVVCRGVPLRIAHEAELMAEVPPLTSNNALRTNAGAVDSELALLAVPGYAINAFVPNPLFNQDRPDPRAVAAIVRVGRLDGATLADARGLVDSALEGERRGLIGRAYVDIGGPHADGDNWLEATLADLASLGFDLEVDRARATFPPHARFDAAALYFGWYAGHANGPFIEPGFRFAPGAVGLHIHSFSATTMRHNRRGWAAPLVARGVGATFGNVYEPYLQFTHRPHLLLRAMARGLTMGEAALYALPSLSWQAILIGDPLYRPFAVGFDQQWEQRATLPSRLAPYVSLRRVALLTVAGQPEEAMRVARQAMRETPGLALTLGLARLQKAANDIEGARQTLGILALLPEWRAQDAPLIVAGAQLLQAADDAKGAVALYQRLLADSRLSRAMRIGVLVQAQGAARAALDFTQLGRWEAEHAELTAPPPTATKQ